MAHPDLTYNSELTSGETTFSANTQKGEALLGTKVKVVNIEDAHEVIKSASKLGLKLEKRPS